MNEVEKYGLFAVIVVGGLITLIAVSGGDDAGASDGTGETALAAPAHAPQAIPFAPARNKNQTANPRKSPRIPHVSEPLPVAANTGRNGARQPLPVSARAHPNGTATREVRSLVADLGPYRPDEEPVSYPGRRSSQPASQLPAPVQAETVTHTVRPGDNLSSIAKAYLGKSSRWKELLDLNPGLDPERLQVGQVLHVKGPRQAATVLSETAPAAAPADKPDTYTVQKGDTLSGIAQVTLGTVKRTDDLFQANRHLLATKDDLKPGQVLIIP